MLHAMLLRPVVSAALVGLRVPVARGGVTGVQALPHARGVARMSTAAAATVLPAGFDGLDVSDVFDCFEFVRKEPVPERGLTASVYRHKATGAEVVSIDAPVGDTNKVFSCNFRTLPKDDTGVPHILEHSVLCGSRRFPLKEPFVEMLKGSLKTFLNAMTGADMTMYPVASQNKQDFYNLVSVYMDACLFPRVLDPTVGPRLLQQEGWHYELPSADAPLTYKGVVFNEMKGVYSSPDQRHYRALKRALFTDHPIYAIDSGGDPRAIPSLTYDSFKSFHQKYYHPSNALLYIYADKEDLPVEERLALLQVWLGEFTASAEAREESIPWQPLASSPYEVSERYASDPKAKEDSKQFVTLGWLFPPKPLEPTTKLALTVLNDLLLGKPSAALQKRLLESKLGASVVGGGYGSSLQQSIFSVGLKGVAVGTEPKQKVVDLILSTLQAIARDGFDEDALEASINTIEFRLRASSASPMKGLSFMFGITSEWGYVTFTPWNTFTTTLTFIAIQTIALASASSSSSPPSSSSSSSPSPSSLTVTLPPPEFRLRASSASPMKGLSFMFGITSEWGYGRDPINVLRFEEPLAKLKAQVAARGSSVFTDLLQQLVLDNPHRVTLSLVPDPAMGAAQLAEEEAELESVRLRLSEDELAKLAEQTAELKEAQAAHDPPEALATLPVLSTSDLDTATYPIPIEAASLSVPGGAATLLTHELPTDGLVYLQVGLPLDRLPLDDVPYIPLLCRMMSELGTETTDEVTFARRVGALTGGMSVGTLTSQYPGDGGSTGDPAAMAAYLMLTGRSTATKASSLFDLASQMLINTNLDARDRVCEMLKSSISRAESAVVSSGNAYASSVLGARFSLAGHVGALMGGLPQISTMKAALAEAETNWPSLHSRLERMRGALLQADGCVVNLAADGRSLASSVDLVPTLLASLPSGGGGGGGSGWEWSAGSGGVLVPSHLGFQVPTQVNYVAKALPIFSPGELISGPSSVVARYLRTAYLWDRVRVQGGAYGCSLAFSRFDGRATLSSYRDPNVASTLSAYDGVGSFLRGHRLGPAELSQAIIGAVGELDAPQSVDAKSYTSMVRYLLGVSEESRQIWRDQVLATTPRDFLEFADRMDMLAEGGSVAVVGSEKAIAEANEELPDGKRLQPRQAL
eukprot:CAMPEP_0174760896 /NCGR_PEP_ID=MMETSP1094-20130205/108996_1 /TAXON_ID=156173 /ORGANISM="Chrysochromulina brevifilum, Strain UTEX LB 985" /LENGTH=1149 /DNA_ID=CAMNT_0015966839 /DNA_START=20 /DNA_END=3471 /DNA_ORIENTATION=+